MSIHQEVSGNRGFPHCSRRLRRAPQRGRFAVQGVSLAAPLGSDGCLGVCRCGVTLVRMDQDGRVCQSVPDRSPTRLCVRRFLYQQRPPKDPGRPEVIALIAACHAQLTCLPTCLHTYDLADILFLHLHPKFLHTTQAIPFRHGRSRHSRDLQLHVHGSRPSPNPVAGIT